MKLPTYNSVKTRIHRDDYSGWCTNCGKWTHTSCEPDAAEYTCPKCKKKTCYGAMELLLQQMFVLPPT